MELSGVDQSDVLDFVQVTELREVLEDEFSAVIEAYLRDAARKVEQVTRAADGGDAEQLRVVVHSLKGSCRNVGAKRLADSCQVIERLMIDEQPDMMPPALLTLRQSLDATRTAFLG